MRIPNFLKDKIIDKLEILLKYKSQNDIGLQVLEVRKRGNKIEIKFKANTLSEFDSSEKEVLEELKIAKYNDLEDMVHWMPLTYEAIIFILDIKYFPSKRTSYTLLVRINKIGDINKVLGIFYQIMWK